MEVSNFTNPLGIVQTISIFSYLNALGGSFFTEEFLRANDRYKQIKSDDLQEILVRKYQQQPRFAYDGVQGHEKSTLHRSSRRKRDTESDVPRNTNRFYALSKKIEIEDRAIAVATERLRKGMRKYVFQYDSGIEIKFVEDWIKGENLIYSPPSWSDEYRTDEPEVFFALRYNDYLESDLPLSETKMRERIDELYTETDKFIIERQPLKVMVDLYQDQEVYFVANFEDYYALRNYETHGYMRITSDTDEARRMEMAICRLAIRQSDDPHKLFTRTMYRGEGRLYKHVKKIFSLKSSNKNYVLDRFTSVSRIEGTAKIFASRNPGGEKFAKVIYEMHFPVGQYPRARVEEIFPTRQQEAILLPGTKFRIDDVIEKGEEVVDLQIGSYVRVEMTCIVPEKHKWQQDIMREIGRLKNSGTRFYHDDPLE